MSLQGQQSQVSRSQERFGKRQFSKPVVSIPLQQKPQEFQVFNPDEERLQFSQSPVKFSQTQPQFKSLTLLRKQSLPLQQTTQRYKEIEQEVKLAQKLKSQNFHISGMKERPRPSTSMGLMVNNNGQNREEQQSFSQERQNFQSSPVNSQQHRFRTSFQDSYMQKQLDSSRIKDIQDIKQQMLRSNITPIMNRKRQNYSQNSQTFDKQLSVREGTSRSQSPTKLQQQNAQEFQIFTDKNVFLKTMDNRVGQNSIQEEENFSIIQNCTIKQPLLSGFGDKLVDERNLINQAGQELEFNIVDHKMRQTLKGEGFKELNFADKMRDHRQSNFKIGSLDNFAQVTHGMYPSMLTDQRKPIRVQKN
eukprot:403335863